MTYQLNKTQLEILDNLLGFIQLSNERICRENNEPYPPKQVYIDLKNELIAIISKKLEILNN